MISENKKRLIVEAIQQGLQNSLRYRCSREILFDNNSWNENLNFIYDSLMNLGIHGSLVCFIFNRSAFKMVALFDKDSNTLFCICSRKKLNILLKRTHANSIHYTDAFCQLSKDPCKYIQTSIFSENDQKISLINDLLKKIAKDFKLISEVKHFAILVTDIDHKSSQLLNIKAVYLDKNYNIVYTDEEWRNYISSDYDLLDNSTITNVKKNENPLSETYLSSSLTLKEKKDIKVKDN